MKNNNVMKSLAVIALVVSVVGVSLGFAAYSNTLQIRAGADYTAPSVPVQAIVELSTASGTVTPGSVTPTVTGTGASAGNATLSATSIQNLSVHFTAPNQKAEYTFYAVNPSSFAAFLNSVTFGTKTCAPDNTNSNPGTQAYVNNACNDIIMTVQVGTGASNEFTETQASISSHSLAAGGNETVKVTIEYIDGGAIADGDFTVDFGTTTLGYSTVD